MAWQGQLMEIDQVAVDAALWKRAQEGDDAARTALRDLLESEVLYLHSMPVQDSEIIVTLRELEALDILMAVTLQTSPL